MSEFGADPLAGAAMEEIAERLARIELLIVGGVQEEMEGNEPGEAPLGAEADVRSALEAAPSPVVSLERFIDGLELPSFRGAELTPYWSRVRNGVRNSPPPTELWKNVTRALAVLQRLRTELGSPVQLLSTYRSPAYNQAVGGASQSQHKQFRAIDFTVSKGSPTEWASRLRSYRGQQFRDPAPSGQTFTFRGGIGVYPKGHFVHLDTRGVDADW